MAAVHVPSQASFASPSTPFAVGPVVSHGIYLLLLCRKANRRKQSNAVVPVVSPDAPSVNAGNRMENTLTLGNPDIRSETKFRRLKAFAESAKISGLAKKGRPGVLVFDGEKEAIRTFLSNARSTLLTVFDTSANSLG